MGVGKLGKVERYTREKERETTKKELSSKLKPSQKHTQGSRIRTEFKTPSLGLPGWPQEVIPIVGNSFSTLNK